MKTLEKFFKGKKEPWWKPLDSLWDFNEKLGDLLVQLEGCLVDSSVSPQRWPNHEEDYKKKKKGKKSNKKVVS